MPLQLQGKIRCRQIVPEDLDSLTELLCRGFPAKSRTYWQIALKRLSMHETPAGFPQFGYLLESDSTLVGVILTIFTQISAGESEYTRCNISSWYVDPAFRSYASLLISKAQRFSDVTYLNASPARHTWPLIEAQGFKRFTEGLFIAALPLTVLSSNSTKARHFDDRLSPAKITPADRKLLSDHTAYGCICLWCETKAGVRPFIFGRRQILARRIPCAHLVYCNSIESLTECAGAISRFLLRAGIPLLSMGATAPVRGFFGRYFPNRHPMYYRGNDKPRIGDLAYTEVALFGL